MTWTATIRLGFRGLCRNRSRALLTVLGVVIGVGAVIAMLAVGTGARERISAQLSRMGSQNVVVRPGSTTRGGVRTGAGSTSTLVLDDARAIAELPGVVAVDPTVRSAAQARYRGANWGTAVRGATPAFITVRDWPVEQGAFITENHVQGAALVCVLGKSVVRELYGLSDPLGTTIIFKNLAWRVIGVLSEKGATAWGTDQDDAIIVPITTAQRKILGIQHIHRIEIKTTGREDAFRVQEDVRRLLRRRHRIREDREDDFRMYNRAELAQASEESARVFAWLLGTIASVSLLVGGIGIMNVIGRAA